MSAYPVAGSLLGLAAGDVLGAGYEGATRRRLRRRYGDRITTPARGSLYTDDTQQALVLSYHLLSNDEIVPQVLARDLGRLAGLGSRTASVYRGIGPGFVAFLGRLAAGASFQDAAQPSAGNGAAMRVAPIAIRFHHDLDTVLEQSIAASRVTHAHPTGVAAAAAMAAAVWASSRGKLGTELVAITVDACKAAEQRLAEPDRSHQMSQALRSAHHLIGASPDDIARAVGEAAALTSATGRSNGTDAYALASVVTAITVGAGGRSEDAAEPVEALVALGGDADTMGAMAGAIIGGSGFFDWPWTIPNRDLMVSVGWKLAAGETGVEDLPDLYELEAALS